MISSVIEKHLLCRIALIFCRCKFSRLFMNLESFLETFQQKFWHYGLGILNSTPSQKYFNKTLKTSYSRNFIYTLNYKCYMVYGMLFAHLCYVLLKWKDTCVTNILSRKTCKDLWHTESLWWKTFKGALESNWKFGLFL